MSSNHFYIVAKLLITPKDDPIPLAASPHHPSPSSWHSLWKRLFPTFHINATTHYIWLLFRMLSRFTHGGACIKCSPLWPNNILSWINYILFIQPSAGHLGCCHLWVTVTVAAVNVPVRGVGESVSDPLGCVAGSGDGWVMW